jgi:hypothetical protein
VTSLAEHYHFTRESYAAVENSKHVMLRSCSMAWRNKIVADVLGEWDGVVDDFGTVDRNQFREELLLRAKRRLRKKVGFPWLPLAFFLAEIIIKILMERWFNK